MSKNCKKLFITGTGTDIGKTYVTGLIIKKLKQAGKNAAYFKAAMSGNDRRPDGSLIPGDAATVKKISGITQPLHEMCPYVYENAYSPHLAAQVEGNPVDMAVVREYFNRLSCSYDYITMEGSGGIICPIRFDKQQLQLENIIKELNMPCLIIADAGLGTINSVVLTAEYMRTRQIPLRGIIFNNYHPKSIMENDNKKMCEQLTGLPILGCVQPDADELNIDIDLLTSLYE